MVQMPVKRPSSAGPNQSATSVEIEVTIKGTETAMPIWPASSMEKPSKMRKPAETAIRASPHWIAKRYPRRSIRAPA